MKRIVITCLIAAASAFFATSSAHASSCDSPYVSIPGEVCGRAVQLQSSLSGAVVAFPPNQYANIKMCDGALAAGRDGGGNCWYTRTQYGPDPSGGYSYAAFSFGSVIQSYAAGHRFYVFMWSDDGLWGSTNTSLESFLVSDPNYYYQITPKMAPRPQQPSAITPSANSWYGSSSIAFEWSKGLDMKTTSYIWPARYDLLVKHWSYGSTEPANFSVLGSNLSCNPNSLGRCTTTLTGLLDGNYKWKVIVKLDLSASADPASRPAYFGTVSPEVGFINGNFGRIPGCCH